MRVTSFSFRIFLLFSIVTTAMILATGALLSGIYYMSTEKSIENSLKNRANTIVRDHIVFDGIELVYKKGPEGETITSRLRDYDVSVVIFDGALNRIGTYGYYKNLVDEGRISDLVSDSQIKEVFTSKKAVYNDVFVSDRLFDLYTMPLLFNNQSVGVLQISVQNTFLTTFLSIGSTVLLLVLPITILLSWVSVFLMTKYSFRPLYTLVQYMEKISFTYLPSQLNPERMKLSELRTVSGAFNRMIERLRDAITKQKSYADHLSHELKTPLSRAVSALDIAVHDLKGNQIANAQTGILDVRQELLTLGQSIDSILQITGNASGPTAYTTRTMLSVDKEIQIMTDQYQKDSMQKHLTVTISPNHSLYILFPKDHFRMILGNLLSNAIKYANTNGSVEIACKHHGTTAEITIENTGNQISPAEIPKVFLRYIRGNIHTWTTRGSGLGLPLVRDLCNLHGLTLHMSTKKNSATRVTIEGFKVVNV